MDEQACKRKGGGTQRKQGNKATEGPNVKRRDVEMVVGGESAVIRQCWRKEA